MSFIYRKKLRLKRSTKPVLAFEAKDPEPRKLFRSCMSCRECQYEIVFEKPQQKKNANKRQGSSTCTCKLAIQLKKMQIHVRGNIVQARQD
jgi:hypothetical protein